MKAEGRNVNQMSQFQNSATLDVLSSPESLSIIKPYESLWVPDNDFGNCGQRALQRSYFKSVQHIAHFDPLTPSSTIRFQANLMSPSGLLSILKAAFASFGAVSKSRITRSI